VIALSLLLGLAAVGPAGADRDPPFMLDLDRDVMYVPTPQPIVIEMLKVANVGAGDVVYDLGSGDGRIVITAAKVFGARGVGVEIDPWLVEEAAARARWAGVADRVTFIQGDLFAADIKDATVVTLYLQRWMNLKLRPRFFSELRPGTRIVSHNYDMGDWKPEKTIRVSLPTSNHTIYYWVVPDRRPGG